MEIYEYVMQRKGSENLWIHKDVIWPTPSSKILLFMLNINLHLYAKILQIVLNLYI